MLISRLFVWNYLLLWLIILEGSYSNKLAHRCKQIINKYIIIENKRREASWYKTAIENLEFYESKISQVSKNLDIKDDLLANDQIIINLSTAISNFKVDTLGSEFWFSMVDKLPSSWHVYGAKPKELNIVPFRFMESYLRYFTISKIWSICVDIKDNMPKSFDYINDGPIPNNRNMLLKYNRCNFSQDNEIADMISVVLLNNTAFSSLYKKEICSAVENISRDMDIFTVSCANALTKMIYSNSEKEMNEAMDICSVVKEGLNLISILSPEGSLLESSFDLMTFTVDFLSLSFPSYKLSNFGKKMLPFLKIRTQRFIESCTNIAETLFKTGGFERNTTIPGNQLKDISEEITRQRLILRCGAIYRYLRLNKPKGINPQIFRNEKSVSPSTINNILKSSSLLFDSCDLNGDFDSHLGPTKDIVAEILLIILPSFPINNLYNGSLKYPLCKVSEYILKDLSSYELPTLYTCTNAFIKVIEVQDIDSIFEEKLMNICNIFIYVFGNI
ncbi:uncharacterized protein CMU_031110 [Cryptosporidium muris RN66]|uniref:Uncharacterized protein n=1 Tax=Cryptosporidium muris (strain RN66) TaxID=441375 RepID=B6AIC9_CRYMR|nr:uncharacterized protein CMU_031110 [Cryptosporidium muris RN66]EEA07970.1 hypothetical protein, conserved [Cryptosporidium muris RN66]|eukprot:XP_002142319.1 hypothetical protein [Cryptosporidium muris RN66]